MMMSIFEMSLVGASLRLSMYDFSGFPHKHGTIQQTLHDSKGPYDKGRRACAQRPFNTAEKLIQLAELEPYCTITVISGNSAANASCALLIIPSLTTPLMAEQAGHS